MKKLLLSILMLVLVSSFVSAYADITFNFDQSDVGAVVYDCLDASCSSVTEFSGAQTSDPSYIFDSDDFIQIKLTSYL